MATTAIIPRRSNQKKFSLYHDIDRALNYYHNPDKTDDKRLVTAKGCDVDTAADTFHQAHQDYQNNTHRSRRKAKNGIIITYQVRQAFKPGEITPEKANDIGVQLAEKMTKGKHAYTVSTHIDKHHVHNHIVWCAVDNTGTRKWENFFNSSKAVARASDRLCLENGLSIVEHPQEKGKHYGETNPPEKRTWRKALTNDLVAALEKKPSDFNALLEEMKRLGWEVKLGKHVAFRATEDGHGRFIRLRSLGEDFSQENLERVIKGYLPPAFLKLRTTKRNRIENVDGRLKLLLDIDEQMKSKGKGYERWAQTYNVKQMAKTINYLSEKKLSRQELNERIVNTRKLITETNSRITYNGNYYSSVHQFKMKILNYMNTREVYTQYKKSGWNKKFYEANKAQIDLHKAMKKSFDEYKRDAEVDSIPKVKDLNEQMQSLHKELSADRNKLRELEADLKEMLLVRDNIDKILGQAASEKSKDGEKNEREKRTQYIR